MSKLPISKKFFDLSDYGRPFARIIANSIKKTTLTPIHVTIGFIIAGFLAIYFMLSAQFVLAGLFLILKSILDAADGELARIKKTPSYTGRYFDSVADILLNLLFLITIAYLTNATWWMTILAFISIQLQGTLFNYYYVILRNKFGGDTTSRVFEDRVPIALPGESQSSVNFFFYTHNFLYKLFDKSIYLMDSKASEGKLLPNWFMTMVSALGLGFQLLIMSIFLTFGWIAYILPFFIGFNLYLFGIILIRRTFCINND